MTKKNKPAIIFAKESEVKIIKGMMTRFGIMDKLNLIKVVEIPDQDPEEAIKRVKSGVRVVESEQEEVFCIISSLAIFKDDRNQISEIGSLRSRCKLKTLILEKDEMKGCEDINQQN